MHVVLTSNSSMEYYPENTLASFKVKLGKPLVFEEQYEVALEEIIYPHRRLTVEPMGAGFLVGYFEVKERKVNVVIKDEKTGKTKKMKKMKRKKVYKNFRVFLAPGIYDSVESLLYGIKEILPEKHATFAALGNKFMVKMHENTVSIKMTPRMAHLLGFTESEQEYSLRNTRKARSAAVQDDMPVFNPRVFEAKFLPNYQTTNTNSLYVYSSIVDHVVVGDTVAPLLRVICPDNDRLGQTVSEKYIKPFYHPVHSNYIDTVEVEIRTTSGALFPFLSSTPVVLTLHFKPRN